MGLGGLRFETYIYIYTYAHTEYIRVCRAYTDKYRVKAVSGYKSTINTSYFCPAKSINHT